MLENDEIVKRMIVIAAVDERILGRAIHNKYHSLIEKSCKEEILNQRLKILTREYFDKLFITGIKLSALNSNELIDYFNALTLARGVVNPEDIRPKEIVQSVESETEVSEAPISNDVFVNVDSNNDQPNFDEFENDDIKQVITTDGKLSNELTEAIKEYELQQYEKEILDDLIKRLPEATPRQIRIWYYRYLLAMKLIRSTSTSERTDVFNYSEESYNDSRAIAALLFVYGLEREVIDLKNDHRKCLENKNETITLSALSGLQIELNPKKMELFFNVLEIVIPY